MRQTTTLFLFLLTYATAMTAASELVNINDAGNSGQAIPYGRFTRPYPRGAVKYPYRIGKREVSNRDYTEFLNATAQTDPEKRYDPQMKISRAGKDGEYTYSVKEDDADKPVNYVNKVNAARYCNWLSGAEVYKIEILPRENGKSFPTIVGWRNLTAPSAPRLYYLPDIHEFHKAAFYNGDGTFRNVTLENRNRPSYYGLQNYASGVQEWVEDKYHAGADIVLGATDNSTKEEALNGITHRQLHGYQADQNTGFRIAATGTLSIAPLLNKRNNYFIDEETQAVIRIRYDGEAAKELQLDVVINNYLKQKIFSRRFACQLKRGVNEVEVDIPQGDGYYELLAAPNDPSFNRQIVKIPFMVMRTPMPDWKGQGNFGFTVHITRWEKRFTFEKVDFDLMRRLGANIIRVDVGYDDVSGNQTALKRIRQKGFVPLAIITGSHIGNYQALRQTEKENPQLVQKWSKHGIPPMAAWYAENVFNLIQANKQWSSNWEMGNEPTYWRILPEDYAQLEKAGYVAAKLADPNCNVMIGDINAIHEPVLSQGAGQFCDSIASHIYGFYVPSFWGIIGKMRALNGWKKAVGIANKPVWLTEIGVCTYSHMHTLPLRSLDEVWRYQSVHIPKTMAGGLAFGATKILNYNYRDVPVESLEEEFGMIDRYGRPKPAAMSYRTSARLLGDAKFAGFIQGHSVEPGKIAGLLFVKPDGKKVATFWRNDVYGQSAFKIPFDKIIHPAEPVKITAKAAELITLDGNSRKLDITDGKATVMVNEYPVFVCGDLNPELTSVKTAFDVRPLKKRKAKVAILPAIDQNERACDLMSGVFREFVVNQVAPVTVHVYNLSDKPIKGNLRLVSPKDWRLWDWEISPSVQPLDIPANGMGSVTFDFDVPSYAPLRKSYYLTAKFEDESGVEFMDKVLCKTTPRQVKVSRWITYSDGFQIADNKDKTELEMRWQAEHRSYGTVYLKNPTPFADNADELKKRLVLQYHPEEAPLHAISLLFIDDKGEFFQIKQNVKPTPDSWNTIEFETDKIVTNPAIIHYGGNKNGKVEFPVKLLGFNFDLRQDDKPSGKIRLKPFDVH